MDIYLLKTVVILQNKILFILLIIAFIIDKSNINFSTYINLLINMSEFNIIFSL